LCTISKVSVLADVQNEIRVKGPIAFARFMEIALYSPRGYYEQQKQIGRAGDFYTSVSVGPLFGELLAMKFAMWLQEAETSELVEIGAHDGSLACDILTSFAEHEPDLLARLNYTIVEPSAHRRTWQRQTLDRHLANVRWADDLPAEVRGVIFSNELLDAMPFHRLRWDAKSRTWKELFVTGDGQQLIWTVGELSSQATTCAPPIAKELAEVLPEGFATEVCPAATKWWTKAASRLQHGYLVGIDYGLTEEEFFRPDRANGTARRYSKHRVSDDLLANPGEQDITAHVNWSAVQRAGEKAGLRTIQFCAQEKFLMEIVERITADDWSAEQIKQLKTLTHPNFLGRAFRVLVQQRD
jgi:SAM-dependent MidA family methyltransferase